MTKAFTHSPSALGPLDSELVLCVRTLPLLRISIEVYYPDKYRTVARQQAWYTDENDESTNYNPFQKRRPRRWPDEESNVHLAHPQSESAAIIQRYSHEEHGLPRSNTDPQKATIENEIHLETIIEKQDTSQGPIDHELSAKLSITELNPSLEPAKGKVYCLLHTNDSTFDQNQPPTNIQCGVPAGRRMSFLPV